MTQLSAQTIRKFCVNLTGTRNLISPVYGTLMPMIDPFIPEKRLLNGKSYGLSAASYDARIAHDLTLGPHPGFIQRKVLAGLHDVLLHEENPPSASEIVQRMFEATVDEQSPIAIAHTIEDFAIPHNVSAQVFDKSTYARLHVSAFNTLLDPGFYGNLTLELVNLSPREVVLRAGDPVCQVVFFFLDETTIAPYAGKYQGQPRRAVGPILEGHDDAEA